MTDLIASRRDVMLLIQCLPTNSAPPFLKDGRGNWGSVTTMQIPLDPPFQRGTQARRLFMEKALAKKDAGQYGIAV